MAELSRFAVVNGLVVDFDKLKYGDIFYLYEPDGTLVGKYMAMEFPKDGVIYVKALEE